MSFASPSWLLGLLALPVLVAVYVYSQRRSRRYAIRFPAAATAALAAVGTAGWRRHLAPLLALLALAALAVAMAKPRTSHQVPTGEASIMLVTDHSGSMAADDVQPSRLAAAVEAADTFIKELPAAIKVGAVAFSTSPDAAQGPVSDHSAAQAVIDSQNADGSTATGDALSLALQLLHGGDKRHPPSAIVLLSDGSANAGQSVVTVSQQAAQERIPIYTVALGTPYGALPNPIPFEPPVGVPPDPQLMQQIAKLSGGRTFTAQTADQLSSIYRHLGRQLGSVTRRHQVTYEFVIAGVILLLVAVMASLRSAARLP
jgi:Ca-activated chloride channel homolog